MFLAKSSPAGFLYVPADTVVRDPAAERSFDDRFWLGFSPDLIAAFPDQRALDALAAARRLRAAADALEARALARLDQLREGSRYVAEEAAPELRVSRHTAGERLERAKALTRRMPRVLALLDAGEIEGHVAGRIAQAAAMLPEEQVAQVDAQLCGKIAAGRLGCTDPTNLLRAVRRLVEKVDPDGQAARARQARADRKVELIHGENGISTLLADLPAEVAVSAYARIDAMARKRRNAGDERNLDQLRADIYADLLLGNDPGITPPKAAAMVYVHMPVDTALTMSDQGCVLDGYGPLPAAIGREILANERSMIRKVITDPATGTVKELGRTRRKPSKALREFIAVRDRECTTPGCHRTARHCDQDHLTDWHKHGPTAEHNLGPKCERDHYLKDQPGWTLDYEPATGTGTMTTPAGRVYTKTRDPVIQPRTPSTQDKPPALWLPGMPASPDPASGTRLPAPQPRSP